MAPPIDAREKLGTALRQALTQTPLSVSHILLTTHAGALVDRCDSALHN